MEVTIKMDTSTVKGKVSAIRNIVSMGAIPMDKRLEYVREIIGVSVNVNVSTPLSDLPSLPRITVKPGSALDERQRAISNRSKDSVPRFFNGTVSKNWDMVNSVPYHIADRILRWILAKGNNTWSRLDSKKGVGGTITYDGYGAYHWTATRRYDIPEIYVIAALLLGVRRRDIALCLVDGEAWDIRAQRKVTVKKARFHTMLRASMHPEKEWFAGVTEEMVANPYLFRNRNISDWSLNRFDIKMLDL